MLEEANELLASRDFGVWGFTSVVYERGDKASFLLGVLSLAPVALILVTFTVAVMVRLTSVGTKGQRPIWHIVDFLQGGMLLNFVLSVVLKAVIKQPRPDHPWEQARRADHGMPSNHSQFMFHYCTALSIVIVRGTTRPRPVVVIQVACLLLLATLVAWSRVYNHYHTLEQVLVGMVLGCGVAIAAEFTSAGRRAFEGTRQVLISPIMGVVAALCRV